MKLLVLGGTKFLGRAAVETALDRGHEVTLFNRGETNPELFPEVEKVHGDRDADLARLADRSWDAVIDTSGYLPRVVRASAEALADSVEHYLFVSSISAYAEFQGASIEDHPRAVLEEGQPEDRLADDYSNYGALKALCEQAVEATLPGRHTLVRPGLIVGPYDPTGRFTYWPHRVARGGQVLAPAPPDEEVQIVDVCNLGSWMVSLSEQRLNGAFNAVHPGISWKELLETCRDVAESDAELVWVDEDFLVERGVGQWMELPMWLDEQWRDFHRADVSRAIAAALTFRPLAETIRGTLDHAETTDDAGLDPVREAELIAAWKAR